MGKLRDAFFVDCNQCGADDYEVLFEAGVAQAARIVRCKSCGLIYANPRAQLVDHENYERYEPIGLLSGVEKDPLHPYRWRYDKERLQLRDFSQTKETLDKLHPSKGRIVELGSGLGYLLRQFRDDGWSVLGVDPWKELSQFTESEHGFETLGCTLEQAQLPSDFADVVVLLHVIEHVPDPKATLAEIFRVLRPGGHMVLETPRYDTFMFRMMGRRERSLRQDGHIYFFTDHSLQKMCETAGFRLVDKQHVGRSLTAERFVWNAANILKTPRFTEAVTRAAARSGLSKVKFRLNLHDMVRVVAQKP